MLETLFSTSQIKDLAKSYNPLSNRGQLSGALAAFYPSIDYTVSSKFELHKYFNDVLIKHYSGESTIKHYLFREFVNRRVVAAFEMNVNSSRVDFLAINGESKSFEIKSGLDNLQKLSKQSTNYSKAFEYNYIVIDEKHKQAALSIIPDHYGVWCFDGSKKRIYRPARLSKALDAEFQLSLLTQKELRTTFKAFGGRISDIIEVLNPEQINTLFKAVLKARYYHRWMFVKDHAERILPIDIQFFFSTNLNPDLIYQTVAK